MIARMVLRRMVWLLLLGLGQALDGSTALPQTPSRPDEARFDPPLGGVYLGIRLEFEAGAPVIRRVEKAAAAGRDGFQVGDRFLALGEQSGWRSVEEITRDVRMFTPGRRVDVRVLRGAQELQIALVPDPLLVRDALDLAEIVRRSRFLSRQAASGAVLARLETVVPGLLRQARTESEGLGILHRELGLLGTSHTAIVPAWTYQHLMASESDGEGGHATGALFERRGDAWFVLDVLDGSPAARAGLLSGDGIASVQAVAATESPRWILAGFEASRGILTLRVEERESLSLGVVRHAGEAPRTITLAIDRRTSGLGATAASQRTIERGGRRLLYVHLWNLLSPQVVDIVSVALRDTAAPWDGLVLDLRGRGGQVAVLERMAKLLESRAQPTVLLQDRYTRSAKEILAQRLRDRAEVLVVGERTAGAVLPGSYHHLSNDHMVMLPQDPRDIVRMSREVVLEGRGVEPEIVVERAGAYSAGADPILEAGVEVLLKLLQDVPRRRRL